MHMSKPTVLRHPRGPSRLSNCVPVSAVLDQDGAVVGLLAEDMGGLGKAVGRQLLRTRRSFTATVFSPDGAPVQLRRSLLPASVHKRLRPSLRQIVGCTMAQYGAHARCSARG